MNNFDLHRRATLLADSESTYQLAKRVVELEERLELAQQELREYNDYCSDEVLG